MKRSYLTKQEIKNFQTLRKCIAKLMSRYEFENDVQFTSSDESVSEKLFQASECIDSIIIEYLNL